MDDYRRCIQQCLVLNKGKINDMPCWPQRPSSYSVMDESTYTCVLQSHVSGRHSVHLDDVADCYCFFSSEPGQTPHITLSRAKWLSTSSLLQAKRRGSVTTCLGGTPCCTVWLAWTLLCFLPPTHSHKSLACSTITNKSSLRFAVEYLCDIHSRKILIWVVCLL